MDRVSKRDDIEIIVSDNGSTKHVEEYEKIRNMKDPHLIYDRLEENIQYYGNFNHIIKLSRGQFSLLISDEDKLDQKHLSDFMEFLENNRDMGMIKVRTSDHYSGFEAGSFRSGEEAIKKFYLSGNYISGTVYNRDYVTDELIDGLKDRYEGDEGYFYYPHLFVESYILNTADFHFYDKCLIIEGDEEGDIPRVDKVTVPLFAAWESRVEQLSGYFKMIRDLQVDDGRKQLMFMMAVCKTISLIALVKDKYVSSGAVWEDVYMSAGNAILQAATKCGIAVVLDNMEAYLQIIADFIRKDMQ